MKTQIGQTVRGVRSNIMSIVAIIAPVMALVLGFTVIFHDGKSGGAQAATAAAPAGLHHITLFAKDNKTLSQWYVDRLGFQSHANYDIAWPNGTRINIIQLKLGDFLMNVSQLADLATRDPQRNYAGWRHIALSTTDSEAAWQALKAAGADVVNNGAITVQQYGYKIAFVRDPEGNFIELYEELRQAAR